MTDMRVVKGKVVGNTVVLEEVLPEGSDVDVVLRTVPSANSEGVELDEETAQELMLALKEADAGDFVSEEEVLAQIEAQYGK